MYRDGTLPRFTVHLPYTYCTLTVHNWFCVHLYSKLVLCTLMQLTGFVYTCTGNWFCVHLHKNWFCETCTVNWQFLAMKASLEVQKVVFCTKVAHWLYKVCMLIAKSLYKFCNINCLLISISKLSWAAHKNHRSACLYYRFIMYFGNNA